MQEVTWRGSRTWLQQRAWMYPTRSLYTLGYSTLISVCLLYFTHLTLSHTCCCSSVFPVSRHVRTCSWISAPFRCSLAWYVCMGVWYGVRVCLLMLVLSCLRQRCRVLPSLTHALLASYGDCARINSLKCSYSYIWQSINTLYVQLVVLGVKHVLEVEVDWAAQLLPSLLSGKSVCM